MKAFTVIALLLAIVNATPVDIVEKDVAPLEKRDTEIVYLANCVNAVSCCTADKHFSQIIYYPKSADSHAGQVPNSKNRCTVASDNFIAWEGSARQCVFPTGVTYTSHIDIGAQGRGDFSWSGWGSNGFKNWDCFKDNQRILFDPYMPEAANYCRSVYYCLPQ